MLRCKALSAFAFLMLSSNLFGQATSGGIFGTVTDPTGAVVANAKVTITNVSKGVTVSTATNESGNYAQTHLTVGTYRISVEASGFKTSVQENVPVSVDTNTRVDLALQVGEVTQEVTVTEAPPLLKSDRADVSDTLSAREVSELPILN